MKRISIGWISLIALITAFLPEAVLGQIRLPELISDGMVLQRNAKVPIWGWADEDQKVLVTFHDSTYQTYADEQGDWRVVLSNLEAGGPFKMIINSDTLRDVWVGDVWVSSGQSNMDLPMYRVRPLYEDDIANAQSDEIRYFEVPNTYNFQEPQETLDSGNWIKTTPETMLNFSAVSYFFARELNQKHDVPIGIINASLGGSPAQAWISEDALKGNFSQYYQEAQRFKDSILINRIQQNDEQRSNKWYTRLNRNDQGLRGEQSWYDPKINTRNWPTMNIPGYWANTALGNINGSVWFRKTIDLPAKAANQPARLNLGRIVDADSVFINGKFVGNITYQYPPRWYQIPKNVLKEGENTIAVRVINVRGKGGFVLDKPYQLTVNAQTIDLKGPWKYRLGTRMKPLKSQTFIRWKPTGLFNAMIAPLFNYRIKGVIWYQGEANTGKPKEYQDLFTLMIKDWREKWNQDGFPFLYVQLANFMEPKNQPSESNWAALREAQRKTLSVPNTGMAVTIDIGEWNDIHPLRKWEVGHRLALAAQKVAYNDNDVVYSGPVIESMKVEDNKGVLTFSHTGSGLVAKGDSLGGFAIAGKDHDFVWANSRIENDKVIVWSHEIKNPTKVRYGWADNPVNANLYSNEGLPASPFEIEK